MAHEIEIEAEVAQATNRMGHLLQFVLISGNRCAILQNGVVVEAFDRSQSKDAAALFVRLCYPRQRVE
jgi:hypothetical protein